MRTVNILIHFAVLMCALLVLNICYSESESVTTGKMTLNEIRWKVAQITIEEAKIIRQIESLVDKYRDPNYKEKQKILDGMCGIYKEYQTTFLGIVLLSGLKSIDRLDILPEPQTIEEREFLTFAKLMQEDDAGVPPYLKNIKDPGLEGFLSVWYAHEKGIDNIPQELKWPREAKVEQFRSQVRIQIKDLSETRKAELLFDRIENWESPLEYEACFPLILEQYEKHPALISSRLKQRFLKNTPSQVPPPYTRGHTVFQGLCFIAIATNDERLVDTISPMANSTNPYVAIKCSEVLKWLEEGVKYPVKYKYLRWAYDSRS